MRITNQFRIILIVFSLALVVIGSSIVITSQQASATRRQENLANNIVQTSNELTYLSSDYVFYPSNTQLIQWQASYSLLSNDLGNLSVHTPEQQALLHDMEVSQQNMQVVFNSITASIGVSSNQTSNANEELSTLQVSWSRISIQSQAVISDATQLSTLLSAQVNQLNTINSTLIFVMIAAFSALLAVIYLQTFRRTIKSISELQAGSAIIGSGNLDFKLPEDKKDELGDLSRSFNAMSANLKTVTASKADLEKAQASLRASEQRWATTLASIGDAVIATDLSGQIMFMNGVAEQLTGWTLGESTFKPVKQVFNIVNEQTRVDVEDPVSRVLEKGTIVGLANHTVLIRKNKTEVTIDDSGAPIKDKEGKTTGVVLIFRDITERKKGEEALKEANKQAELGAKRLETILETTPTGVVIVEADGRISFVNKRAAEIYGFDSLGLDLAANMAKIKPKRTDGTPYKAEDVPASIALRGQVVHGQEVMIERADGRQLQLLVSAAPLLGDNGAITSAVNVLEDVTERKKVEEATARQAELIDLSPDAIIVRKLDGTITLWSKGAEKLYGLTKEEAVGQDINSLLKTKFPQPLDEILNKLKLDGKWSGEVVHTCKSGDKLVVQSYWLAKFGLDGNVVEMLESNVDITDRIEMQSKLEESAVRVEEYATQMEELANKRLAQLKDAERLAAIGATAGMVGHDIRNPLQAITSDVYLAKTELESIPDGDEKKNVLESLQEIEKNTDYINKIVADLQDFARPLKPSFEESDLKLIIEELLKKNRLPDNVKVTVNVANTAQKIVADPTYVNRILYNLVTNAVQAMPKGGKLTLHAYTESNDVLLTVKDTGVGIPEAVKDKLFTPMFTTKSKGQGFGLVVIKRMTESLGGTVSFESQEGKGTTFIIRLPLKR